MKFIKFLINKITIIFLCFIIKKQFIFDHLENIIKFIYCIYFNLFPKFSHFIIINFKCPKFNLI